MFLITFALEKMCTISGKITGDEVNYSVIELPEHRGTKLRVRP